MDLTLWWHHSSFINYKIHLAQRFIIEKVIIDFVCSTWCPLQMFLLRWCYTGKGFFWQTWKRGWVRLNNTLIWKLTLLRCQLITWSKAEGQQSQSGAEKPHGVTPPKNTSPHLTSPHHSHQLMDEQKKRKSKKSNPPRILSACHPVCSLGRQLRIMLDS